jgi:type IV pilus assembly protein PilM
MKAVTVGVDISRDALRLVKTMKTADNRRQMLAYQTIPLNPWNRRGTAAFSDLLKSELSRFCGSHSRANIWAVMTAANASVRHIRIPKVAKGEIENVVFWSVKKEAPFNENETLLDFEVLEEVVEQDVPKWLVMTCTAPRREVEELKNLFSKAGFPLAGISIVPIAIQNLFRTEWMPTPAGTVASLFIGNDFSRIDIYSRGNLVMTRGIKTGINSMVESIQEFLLEQARSAVDEGGEKKPAISPEQARKVLFSLSPDAEPLNEQDAGHHLTQEEKHRIVLPAMQRLVRQIERTFEYYEANIDENAVGKIFISSAMSIYPPLIAYIGEAVGIESDLLNPFDPALPGIGGLFREGSLSERVTLAPALGIALSDRSHTPNLLFTFKDKERLAARKRAGLVSLAVFAAAAALAAGFFLYELGMISVKKTEISSLQKELARFQPRISRNEVMQIAAQARQQRYSPRAYSERYRGMAVIGELSALTPSDIRLVNVKADFAPLAADKAKAPPKEAAPAEKAEKKDTAKATQGEPSTDGAIGNVVVEGVILGNRQSLDASLADYITRLQTSPVFRQVTIQKNSVERTKKRDVLHFTITMKIATA